MSAEQSWWQTLPGVLTATAGVLSAITALVVALNQAGIFKTHSDPVAAPSLATAPGAAPNPSESRSMPTTGSAKAPATRSATSAAATPHSQILAAPSDKQLLAELKRANVGYSVSESTMLGWLNDADGTFRRIGRAAAHALDGKRLRGNATDLDVIKYHYLALSGVDGGGILPVDVDIDDTRLHEAIVAAFNDKNGTSAKRLDAILDTP